MTETLANKLETNRQFVSNCRRIAGNAGAHRFANTDAGNDAYEAKMTFLASLEKEVLPIRAKVEAELLEEHQDMLVAIAVEQEQAARAAERIKFNSIVGDVAKSVKADMAQ